MTEKERKQWTNERAKLNTLPMFQHPIWDPVWEDFAFFFEFALYDKNVFKREKPLKELTRFIINKHNGKNK